MKVGRNSKIRREDLLDAAEQVILHKGVSNLTLDAVAARANVSKGGLLYNYRSKDELIGAMLKRMLEELDAATNAALEVEGPEPSRYARALVKGGLGSATSPSPQRTALLAAVANNPKLLEGQGQSYRASIDQMMEEGLDFEKAAIIALATDGLWLLELIGVKPFNPEEREWIVAALCKFATLK